MKTTQPPYDLIIIGAGAAGMACAIEAAERGLNVLVLEKAREVGGALHWSGGHMSAAGCRRQKAAGITDSPDQHLEDILRINGGSGDLDLIRLAVNEAPHTIDWLEDNGFEFAPECPRIIYGHVPYNLPRTVYGREKGLSVLKVLERHWHNCVKYNDLRVLFGMTVTSVQADSTRFDTVTAQDEAGTVHTFKASEIVVTTGGYGSGQAYFSQKHPDIPLVSTAYPTALGEGHQLLEQLGAAFCFSDCHLPSLGGLEMPPGSGRCDFNSAWAMVLTSVYRPPREVYLNACGERFMDENEINADTRERIVAQQPQHCFWAVFDHKALLEREKDGSENQLIIGWDAAKIQTEATHEKAIWQADSLEELAQKCGLPEQAIVNTIAAFNEAVAAGHDPLFHRRHLKNNIVQPPFYAVKIHASLIVTFGGIRVNAQLQVLDTQGRPLPGLYAAGEILGLGATSGNAFCSGMALTPALSFGRILGKSFVRKS